jgi:hypothetical protein
VSREAFWDFPMLTIPSRSVINMLKCFIELYVIGALGLMFSCAKL